MAARSERMYKDSPKLERDEESGKVAAKKPEKKADVGNDGSNAEMPDNIHPTNERRETKHRHVAEHLAMHHRHEMEHASHTGDKKEMHGRHEAELAEMHSRHAGEMKKMHARHEKSGENPEAKKIESKAA